MPSNRDLDRALLGGVDVGTASHRLRKMVLFEMVKRLDLNICFQCKKSIGSAPELSIEHKKPWRVAADPVVAFYDLSGIAFSHHSCNSGAARQTQRKYENSEQRETIKQRRNQPNRLAKRKLWRQRQRDAGLPYT